MRAACGTVPRRRVWRLLAVLCLSAAVCARRPRIVSQAIVRPPGAGERVVCRDDESDDPGAPTSVWLTTNGSRGGGGGDDDEPTPAAYNHSETTESGAQSRVFEWWRRANDSDPLYRCSAARANGTVDSSDWLRSGGDAAADESPLRLEYTSDWRTVNVTCSANGSLSTADSHTRLQLWHGTCAPPDFWGTLSQYPVPESPAIVAEALGASARYTFDATERPAGPFVCVAADYRRGATRDGVTSFDRAHDAPLRQRQIQVPLSGSVRDALVTEKESFSFMIVSGLPRDGVVFELHDVACVCARANVSQPADPETFEWENGKTRNYYLEPIGGCPRLHLRLARYDAMLFVTIYIPIEALARIRWPLALVVRYAPHDPDGWTPARLAADLCAPTVWLVRGIRDAAGQWQVRQTGVFGPGLEVPSPPWWSAYARSPCFARYATPCCWRGCSPPAPPKNGDDAAAVAAEEALSAWWTLAHLLAGLVLLFLVFVMAVALECERGRRS